MIDQLSPDVVEEAAAVVEEAAAVVEEAAAVVKVADAEVAKLRSVSADLDERSLAAAQATELASSNHRRGLGQRELGESISDTTLAKLKSDRADAVFVEEGLAEARKEIADRLSRAEADLLAATETLLLARIRMVCTLAQGFINDTLYHDALAGAHVDSLKALAVEANRDRAALQNLCGVRLLLPDFCTLYTAS